MDTTLMRGRSPEVASLVFEVPLINKYNRDTEIETFEELLEKLTTGSSKQNLLTWLHSCRDQHTHFTAPAKC